MKSYFDLLPDKLVRRIFSDIMYLTTREAIGLSLVSKRFLKLLHNRPNLISRLRVNKEYMSYKHKAELSDLCSTLKRYQDENIHLESLTFSFDTMFRNLSYGNDDIRVIDKCIELAAKNNGANLHISFPGYPKQFVLPKAVFGAESLVKLSVKNCCLRPDEGMIFAWPNLRELCLHYVNLNSETVFENVLKGCPLIETLDMNSCCMEKPEYSFKVSNLPNLKNLHVGSGLGNTVEVLASAAANLECIKSRMSSLNLGKHEYPKLKTLDLCSTEVDDNLITDFASKFPRLEYLEIRPISGKILRMNLSSPTLKEVCMFVDHKVSLEEACFDVPNIVRFKYYQDCRGKTLPKLSFTRGRCIAQIKLAECPDVLQGSWLLKQKQFFAQLNIPFEASIQATFLGEVFLNGAQRMNLSCPPTEIITGIREFTITQKNSRQFSLFFARVMLDSIVSIYRPQTITFDFYSNNGWDYHRQEHTVKYLLDATNPNPRADEILELLKPLEKNPRFNAVFNLEYV